MKLIKIVGHPVTVMILFMLVLISGENFGGFYVVYILMGLPHGATHSIVAIAGLLLMVMGYNVYRNKTHLLKPLLYIAGDGLQVLALIIFFEKSKGYNDSTFSQTVPLLSFSLFGLCILCNVILSFIMASAAIRKDDDLRVAS